MYFWTHCAENKSGNEIDSNKTILQSIQVFKDKYTYEIAK